MKHTKIAHATTLLIACAILSPALAQDQDAPALPGGASSLQETFGDWRVTCQVAKDTNRCGLSQQQVTETGQRMLAIELVPGPDRTATGALVLPFGLLLSGGVTLQVDEQPALAPQTFRTCLPAGCIVPLRLDETRISALRAGTTLKVTARSSETEQNIELGISLTGFSAAIDRSRALIEN